MTSRLAFALLTSSLFTAACAERPDDLAAIQADLELDNGGLDNGDEAPAFADPAFAAADLEADATVDDPMATDAEVERLRDPARADITRLRVAIVWGQLPPDRTAATGRIWTGQVAIDDGALVVRRTVGFEADTDHLEPRTARDRVQFASITRPFADGLVLEVLTAATDLSAVSLTYTSADGATVVTVPLAAAVAGPVSTDVDSAGNRLVVTALHRDDSPCDSGFMRGRWHQLNRGAGRFMGVINDSDGAPVGHLRGIWGIRRDGDRVFFAKFISPDGGFRGIFAGQYRDGAFAGRWLIGTGEHGRAQGHYREGSPGADIGGSFVGRWAETGCGADLPAAP